MDGTTKAKREAARAKVTANRRKMAAFVMRQTSAKLDDEAIVVNDAIVLSGELAECERVRDYMAGLGAPGVAVDELDPELGTWTCVRIPMASLETALAALRK